MVHKYCGREELKQIEVIQLPESELPINNSEF